MRTLFLMDWPFFSSHRIIQMNTYLLKNFVYLVGLFRPLFSLKSVKVEFEYKLHTSQRQCHRTIFSDKGIFSLCFIGQQISLVYFSNNNLWFLSASLHWKSFWLIYLLLCLFLTSVKVQAFRFHLSSWNRFVRFFRQRPQKPVADSWRQSNHRASGLLLRWVRS